MNEQPPKKRNGKEGGRKNQYSRPKSAFTQCFLDTPDPLTETLEVTENIQTTFNKDKPTF